MQLTGIVEYNVRFKSALVPSIFGSWVGSNFSVMLCLIAISFVRNKQNNGLLFSLLPSASLGRQLHFNSF